MSNHRLSRIEYLKRRAKELRAIADKSAEDHYRQILLECAADYEQLAEMQKRLAEDPPEPNIVTRAATPPN